MSTTEITEAQDPGHQRRIVTSSVAVCTVLLLYMMTYIVPKLEIMSKEMDSRYFCRSL